MRGRATRAMGPGEGRMWIIRERESHLGCPERCDEQSAQPGPARPTQRRTERVGIGPFADRSRPASAGVNRPPARSAQRVPRDSEAVHFESAGAAPRV